MHAGVAGHGVVRRPEAAGGAEGVLVRRAAARLVVKLDRGEGGRGELVREGLCWVG